MLYLFRGKPHLNHVFISSKILIAVQDSHTGLCGLIFAYKQDITAVSGFSLLKDPVQVERFLYEGIQVRVFIPLQIVIRRFPDPAVRNERGGIGRR